MCGCPSSGVPNGMRRSAVSPSSNSLLFCVESRSYRPRQLCMLPGTSGTKTQRALGRAYECQHPGMSAIMTHVCGFLLPSAGRLSAQTLITSSMTSLLLRDALHKGRTKLVVDDTTDFTLARLMERSAPGHKVLRHFSVFNRPPSLQGLCTQSGISSSPHGSGMSATKLRDDAWIRGCWGSSDV